MTVFYIAQAMGILATICAVITMQFKNLRNILFGQIFSNLLIATNYILLGGVSGAAVCILASGQTAWIYFYNKKQKSFPVPINICFMIGYIIVSGMSFAGFSSVLSCAAALLYALSMTQKNAKMCRMFMLVNSVIWIVYDCYTGAYTAFLTHGFLIASILFAMIRLDRNK